MPRERRPDESFNDYWTSLHAEMSAEITKARDELNELQAKIRKFLDDNAAGACGVRTTKPKKR